MHAEVLVREDFRRRRGRRRRCGRAAAATQARPLKNALPNRRSSARGGRAHEADPASRTRGGMLRAHRRVRCRFNGKRRGVAQDRGRRPRRRVPLQGGGKPGRSGGLHDRAHEHGQQRSLLRRGVRTRVRRQRRADRERGVRRRRGGAVLDRRAPGRPSPVRECRLGPARDLRTRRVERRADADRHGVRRERQPDRQPRRTQHLRDLGLPPRDLHPRRDQRRADANRSRERRRRPGADQRRGRDRAEPGRTQPVSRLRRRNEPGSVRAGSRADRLRA